MSTRPVDDVALAAKENKPEPGSQPEEAAEDNMSNGARGTRDAGGAAGSSAPSSGWGVSRQWGHSKLVESK